MITDEFLGILRCPESRQPLKRSDAQLVAKVNREIAAGRLRNRAGHTVVKPVDGLLVREDDHLAYPMIDDIPILLADEAVELT
ncbi:MAG: hypothetical protein WD894_14090 [Pirellulales bacterium]